MSVSAEILEGSNIKFLTHFLRISPKFTLLCGECGVAFKTRFSILEMEDRNPYCVCPACGEVNQVGIFFDGEEIRLDCNEEEEW
jgi:uncharacterized Zn finger protein